MKTDCWECGGKKSVSEGPYNSRYYWHCHRCGMVKSEEWSPMLRKAPNSPTRQFVRRAEGEDPTSLPEAPTEAMLVWLGRYGVSWRQFESLGGSVAKGRLKFSCPSFDALRNVGNLKGPKWLMEARKPLGDSRIAEWGWGEGKTLVITEDSMAALKAALAGFHGFPLLGTNSSQLSPHRFKGYRIRVLTDPDDAGRMAGHKIAWALRGLDVKVLAGKEPKEYDYDELRQLCSVG